MSFRSSITRHAAGAGGLVVLVAALFWMIGAFQSDAEPEQAASDGPLTDAGREVVEQQEEASPSESGEGDDADDLPQADAGETDDAEDGAGEGEGGAGTSPEVDDTDAADADDGDSESEGEGEGEQQPAETAPAIDPSTISVQVLDGYQADGGTAANAVAEQLAADGYDIVARNPAIRYDVTTVLWTAGFEDEGRQVAAAIGAADSRQQPGNLSEAVAVHVVVGADRG